MLRYWIFLFLIISSNAVAFDFQAFRFVGDRNIEISDVHFSSESVDFGFVIETGSNFSGTIRYVKDAVNLFESPVELRPGERFTFPQADKNIVLEDYGTHTFMIYQGDQILEQRSVVLRPELDSTMGVDDFSQSTSKPAPVTDIKQNRYTAFNFEPTSVIVAKERSIGSAIYKEHSDSVVLISTSGGFGSGSVISEDGLILTNWHVVGDEKEALVIFRPKGFAAVETGENYAADVVKVDRDVDLAVLKIRYLPRKLQPIQIASPETIEIAEDVHAIGHPKGNYWTYTKGVISQIRPQFEWTGDGKIFHFADVLQTQTPINPGNSGGPLLDDQGRMVGVNSFGDSGADGLNYAVASSTVASFIKLIPEENSNESQTDDTPSILGSHDGNKDGYADIWYLDYDNNQVIDCIEKDTNFDGEIDVIFIDKNENGTAELIIDYVTVEGELITIVSIDSDEDGIRDQIAYDYDMDGNIDKVEDA